MKNQRNAGGRQKSQRPKKLLPRWREDKIIPRIKDHYHPFWNCNLPISSEKIFFEASNRFSSFPPVRFFMLMKVKLVGNFRPQHVLEFPHSFSASRRIGNRRSAQRFFGGKNVEKTQAARNALSETFYVLAVRKNAEEGGWEEKM